MECSPREPHTRKYMHMEDGQERYFYADVNNMGVVEITEELLDWVLTELAGLVEVLDE